jgi:hypothetical protein
MKITKSICLPFMLLVLLVHTFGHGFVFMHYQLNKKFISEKFCKNRAKPKMNCNGKCHLKKTLKQLDGSSKEKSSSPILEFSQYLISSLAFIPFINSYTIKNQYPLAQTSNMCIGYSKNIFHPPLC